MFCAFAIGIFYFIKLFIKKKPTTTIEKEDFRIDHLDPSLIKGANFKGLSKEELARSKYADPLYKDPLMRIFFYFKANFGLKFFMIFMEGNNQEIFGYCIVNLFTFSSSYAQMIGAGVSLSFILYYGFFCFYVYMFISRMNKIKRKRKRILLRLQQNASKDEDNSKLVPQDKKQEEKLEDEEEIKETFEDIKYGLVAFMVEDYREDLKAEWHYYIPIIMIAKNLIGHTLVYFLSETGLVQVGIVLVLEAVVFVLLAIARMR